jgi:hypothetical protein
VDIFYLPKSGHFGKTEVFQQPLAIALIVQSRIFRSLVLQITDSHCQLSECAGLEDVLPILKTPDGAFGNSRSAREKFGRELFRFGSDFV